MDIKKKEKGEKRQNKRREGKEGGREKRRRKRIQLQPLTAIVTVNIFGGIYRNKCVVKTIFLILFKKKILQMIGTRC